jgi:levanase
VQRTHNLPVRGIIAGFALALVGVMIVTVLLQQHPSREDAMLARIAAAERDAHNDGGYLPYWRTGSDRGLEAWDPEIGRGVDDARVITCADGWVAAVASGDILRMRSSVSASSAPAPAPHLTLPGCVSRVATDAMLADMGFRPQPGPATDLGRPAGFPLARPGYHVTPPAGFMNDPQKPVFIDDLWHLYYLYNADYPEGNGTSWFHLTSPDLVTWSDEGVAIEKFANGWGDVETGTVLVDADNDAGFGHNAVLAIMTQQHNGVQRQSLFYSRDGGYSFASAADNPIMENPGADHWRDPRVVRDDVHDRWVMVLAEGSRLGLYTSTDLRDWTYRSDVPITGLGLVECPDLFEMTIDGDPDRRTWVLAASANNAAAGGTTGVAYWTGEWRDTTFVPTDASPQWLDAGPDFYAGVTWDDPRLTDAQRAATRYSLGWLNNWAYARELPDDTWTRGALSVPRTVTLRGTDDGTPRLVMAPVPQLDTLAGAPTDLHTGALTGRSHGMEIPGNSDSFRVDATVTRGDAQTVQIILEGTGESSVVLDYRFATGTLSINRQADATTRTLPDESGYGVVRSSGDTPGDIDDVRLTVFVDTSSVEVFTGDGVAASALLNLGSGDRSVTLATDGGTAEVREATVRALSPIQLLARR